MTDGSGNVINTYSYEPYGKQLTSTGSAQNAIKYSNGYQDNTTGLYKFGARYYNTSEGRWTQTDPSGKSVGYVYSNNDPINFSDPSGYFSLTPLLDNRNGRCDRAIAGGALVFGIGLAFVPLSAGASAVIGAEAAVGTYAADREACAGYGPSL